MEPDVGEGGNRIRDPAREQLAVHGQRASRGYPHLVRHADDQRPHPAHLLLEEARRLVERVAAQTVRTHELGQVARLVHRRLTHGPHLEEIDRNPPARELPSRLAPRQPAPDDDDAFSHARSRS